VIELRVEVFMVCLLVTWASAPPALSQKPLGVLVIGDDIPDKAFLQYDPALRYTLIPFPTVNLIYFEDQAQAMARFVRAHVPREEGRFWEAFEEKYQFVINLPYLQSYPLQDSPYWGACVRLMRYVGTALLNGHMSELIGPSLAHSSGIEISRPYRGRLYRTSPEEPVEDAIWDLPFDLLRGKPSRSFSLNIKEGTIFEQFRGTGIENYHDATLDLLAHPLPATKIPIAVNITGGLRTRLKSALAHDPGALRKGEIPWLMYSEISKTAGSKDMAEVFKNARGLTWACASPLNGPFFFPRGGYVATSPAFDPRNPPSINKVSMDEDHPYAWDIVSTMIYYSCNRSIPDLLQVHRIRTEFVQYWRRYLDILHVLDWVEEWRQGPVVNVVWRDLEEVERKKAQAAKLYLNEDYTESGRQIRQALDIISEAEKHAKMSLTEALAWVYFVETCVVVSTFLMSGSITLYFVGARRVTRVGETRLRHKKQ